MSHGQFQQSGSDPAGQAKAQRQAQVHSFVNLYRQGWFPMADGEEGPVSWVAPENRCLLPLDHRFHVSRSLQKTLGRAKFEVTTDRAFHAVVRACAEEREDGCWLNDEIIGAFDLLHQEGFAHSIEAWLPGQLNDSNERPDMPDMPDMPDTPDLPDTPDMPSVQPVGGIYGLAIGGAFCAESMFCRPDQGGTDASKVCLWALVDKLRKDGYVLLDTQLFNSHTARFGAFEVPHAAYLALLARAQLIEPAPWHPHPPHTLPSPASA